MKLHINWTSCQNFMSTQEKVTVDYNAQRGLNFITGTNLDGNLTGTDEDVNNGAGKTVIFVDSPLFTFYGKTMKKLTKSNVPNRDSPKKCETMANFHIDDDEFEIHRGVNPAFLRVLKNGEPVTKSTIAHTQTYITEEVIKTSYDVFKKSIILSVTDAKSIFDMGAAEKRKFIEELFNLMIIGAMHNDVKKDANTIKRDVLDKKNQYARLESIVSDLNTQKKSFEVKKQEKLNLLTTRLNKYTDELNGIELTEVPQDTVNKYKQAKKLLKQRIQQANDTNHNAKSEIKLNNSVIQFTKANLTKAEGVNNIVGDCCHDVVMSHFNVKDDEEKLATCKQIIADNTELIDATLVAISKLEDKIGKISDKLEEFANMVANNVRVESKAKNLEQNITQVESDIELADAEVSDFDDMIKKHSDDLVDILAHIKTQSDHNVHIDVLLKILSPEGFKKFLIRNIVGDLNSKITEYLQYFGTNHRLVIEDDFDTTFITDSGNCSYYNFSSGEQMRFQHAFTLAVRNLLSYQGNLECNILVADELLDSSIDKFCLLALLNILKQETTDGRNVFVISHRAELAKHDSIDNVIEVKKENGTTTISLN